MRRKEEEVDDAESSRSERAERGAKAENLCNQPTPGCPLVPLEKHALTA